MSFPFKLKAHADSEVPNWKEAAQAALDFASPIQTTWKKGKYYDHIKVQTYNTRIDGDFWMCRVSKHSDVPFEWFEKGILANHTENEVKYIPLLDSYRPVNDFSAKDNLERWYGAIVHYKFPKFFSDREMAVWILPVAPDPEKKQFVVVSLPSNRPVASDVTQAIYCSLEVVTLLEDGKTVEWLMAQTSDASGSIPRWIQDKSVTASVVEDVPSFVDWARDNYGADEI